MNRRGRGEVVAFLYRPAHWINAEVQAVPARPIGCWPPSRHVALRRAVERFGRWHRSRHPRTRRA